jgi:hypothetical protein
MHVLTGEQETLEVGLHDQDVFEDVLTGPRARMARRMHHHVTAVVDRPSTRHSRRPSARPRASTSDSAVTSAASRDRTRTCLETGRRGTLDDDSTARNAFRNPYTFE